MSHHNSPNHSPLSDARLNANRQNAQLSSGPTTDAGKLISSKNAIKTALTGRTVLLPTDDAERYASHLHAYSQEIAPEGQRETFLTQSVADAAWRLERIQGFEMAIFAKGRAFFANCYPDEPETLRAALIELDIYQTHERELRNLHLQEARIRRQRDRDNEELRMLQAERKRLLQEQLALAAEAYTKAQSENKPFDPAALGFVFSTVQIERFMTLQKAKMALQSAAERTVSLSLKRSRVA